MTTGRVPSISHTRAHTRVFSRSPRSRGHGVTSAVRGGARGAREISISILKTPRTTTTTDEMSSDDSSGTLTTANGATKGVVPPSPSRKRRGTSEASDELTSYVVEGRLGAAGQGTAAGNVGGGGAPHGIGADDVVDAPERSGTPVPRLDKVTLDAEYEVKTGYGGVRALCASLVEGWSDFSRMSCSKVSGGITNALFKVTYANDDDDDEGEAQSMGHGFVPRDAVVVRVFGKGTDVFITHRAVQGETSYALNERGFGAKILGVFANGLVEEFIKAESVAPEELASGGKLLRRVAGQMRRLHKEVSPELIPQLNSADVQRSRANAIWDTLQLWFDLAYGVANDPSMFRNDSAKRSLLDSLKIDASARSLLFEVVRSRCDAVNSQTVYCHNDIHAGNFLLDRKTDNLTLIDYEYADFGPRAFDMANLFCEFAGFECNYDQFPTAALRREFYAAYLPSDATTMEIDALEAEVAAWTPVTHAFWALWAVIQAKYSAIDFDFLGFAEMRLKVFRSAANEPQNWVPTNQVLLC